MQVAAALICDYASVRENLLFVVGGGITRLWRAQFPAALNVSLALMLELHQMELGRPHELEVVVQDQDGTQVASLKGAFQTGATEVEVGENVFVPLAFNDFRGASLQIPGPYTIEVSVDGTHQRTLRFAARPSSEKPSQ